MTLAVREPFPSPVPLYPYGCRIEDIPDDIKTWDGYRPIDMIPLANMPPVGWYSVGHWSSLVSPGIYDFFDAPLAEVLTEMEDEIAGECRKQGIEPVEWPAPPALVTLGISTVLLFPDPILRDATR